MAISGKVTINVGLPNESTNSDSLYTAFNKINNNFSNIFSYASPYNNFIAGDGISIANAVANNVGNVTITNTGILGVVEGTGINAVVTSGNVTVTNTGVTSIVAGQNISINSSNGAVTIGTIATGTVTSVGISPSARLTTSGGPITTSGSINLDLAVSGVAAGSYINPSLNVDTYGRITAATSGNAPGTVTSVDISSTTLDVYGGPIVDSGSITVELPGIIGKTIFTGAISTPPVEVTFATSAMTLDCSLSNIFTTTLTDNVTGPAVFSNIDDGQKIEWFLTQDATGGRTMTWDSTIKWPGGVQGVLSTAANAVDILEMTYRSATGFWYANLYNDYS